MIKILFFILLCSCTTRPPKFNSKELYLKQLETLTAVLNIEDLRQLNAYRKGFNEGCQVALHVYTYDFKMSDPGIAPHCNNMTKKTIMGILNQHTLNQ